MVHNGNFLRAFYTSPEVEGRGLRGDAEEVAEAELQLEDEGEDEAVAVSQVDHGQGQRRLFPGPNVIM